MHPLIFGHSFAVLVAPILLLGLAFYFLNRKKASVRKDVEDADTSGSGSLTALTGSNSGGSSSSPTESNDGAASSSSTAPTGNNYEVFLSFRGPDIRNGFADHLYRGLVAAGIDAFRDDEELRQGEKIGPDLLAAIKNSKISIPILSENYGLSKWCLDELVQIMECKNSQTGHIVLPIFYKVAPADVRHQIGKFGEAFRERERRSLARGFDPTILEKWKQALEEVGDLKGREANGPEGKLVQSIVQEVLSELIAKFKLGIPENLIGIDSQVEEVMKFVANNSHATLFVGIHGMGGIGKTTLAKTIYNHLFNQFQYHSFIADIREKYKNGVEHLQNKLIYDILKKENLAHNRDAGIKLLSSKFKDKKVLILLDDMDADVHLKDLAGSRDWFSLRSVIIITTRNKSLLDNAEMDFNYELEEMDKKTSSILFSRHAFRKDAPPPEFDVLTHDVVCTTRGLPLSLEVVGSFLRGKSQRVWEDTIKKLRNVPHKEVQKKLRISYDALDYEQQQIFLDIACFFIGIDLRIASYMWDACDWYPNEGIVVLRLMSLIKIGENHELRMHDQLRDLGREIVREKGKREPRNYSRLWDPKEALKVLKEDWGTEEIEAICLREDSSVGFGKTKGDNILVDKQFTKLRNLRFLDAKGKCFRGDFENSIMKLKWLQWENCPSTFEAKNFHVEELRVLNLRGINISDKWQGWSWIKMAKKLKYLDLSFLDLKETSFLSAFGNLEVLILRHCVHIEQIDSSIGNMKSLVRLDLSHCGSLEGLPAEVGRLKALEQLLLRACFRISSLPCSIWGLQNLEILDISGTGIKKLPDSIGALQHLKILDISVTQITELPDGIGALQNLEILKIGLADIKELPNSIGRLRKLRDLDASGCRQLGGDIPESIRNLASLQCLNLVGCYELKSLSVLPSSLTYLNVTYQSPRFPSLSNMTHLKKLYLNDCKLTECIWDHPSTLLEKSLITPYGLEILDIRCCRSMKTLDVSQLTHLRTLTVKICTNLLEIRGLDQLKYLESLEIESCSSIERLDLSKSKGLKKLSARCDKNLVEIQGLEFLKELVIVGCTSIKRLNLAKSENLEELRVVDCGKLTEIQGLNRLESLKTFHAPDCKNLIEIQGLDRLEFLERIDMRRCPSFRRLPDLCCFDTLRHLSINCCDNLHDIQSLERFPSLTQLSIGEYNKSLAKLPTFRHLRFLTLSNCHELREILGLEQLTSLVQISFLRCSLIEILPDFSSLTNMISLTVRDCKKLIELRGLEKLEKLGILGISGCESLKIVPKLRVSEDVNGSKLRRVYFEPVLEEEE